MLQRATVGTGTVQGDENRNAQGYFFKLIEEWLWSFFYQGRNVNVARFPNISDMDMLELFSMGFFVSREEKRIWKKILCDLR